MIQLDRARLIQEVPWEIGEQSLPFERPPPPPEARRWLTTLLEILRRCLPFLDNPLQFELVELLPLAS
jgi:hypothetical protein